MFDDEFLRKLRKYKVPYLKTANSLSFPTPAYTHNPTLRWVRRTCPVLYYKITGECRDRPCGYNWQGETRKVKKRYREVYYYLTYADFYGSNDEESWKRVGRKLVIADTVEAPVEWLEYKHMYMNVWIKPVIEKVEVRRLEVL